MKQWASHEDTMYIKRIKLHNFKRFRYFDSEFNSGLNILVGDNEVGKSTVLEAIHLALTGLFCGRYLKRDLTHYIFNHDAIDEYFSAVKDGEYPVPPFLSIELWFDDYPNFVGNTNSESDVHASGITYSVLLNEDFKDDFEQYVRTDSVDTLPVEYYNVVWQSFGREPLISRKIPLKSFLIDNSTSGGNLSNSYVSHLLNNLLSDEDRIKLAHVHRECQHYIEDHEHVKTLNKRLNDRGKLADRNVTLSSDYSSTRTWESALIANINRIPLHFAGKGCQIIVKTKLSLIKSDEEERASVILIEEPESHLSFSTMNMLIDYIKHTQEGKQLFVTTHSSFVINKLGLDSLILLSEGQNHTLKDLSNDTLRYFEKLAGFDTLRMLLAKKSILVEGDSDELIVQKAYLQKFNRLPIEDGIDVQCIHGTSFLRYLELARLLGLSVCVVTDNDGKIDSLKKKYHEYMEPNGIEEIRICYSEECYNSESFDGDSLDNFNYNTLEPCLLKANSLNILNSILGKKFEKESELLNYMHNNKTDCALAVFCSPTEIAIPAYIQRAIDNG